jgi:branched-chain amino acid transport system substrate-binding protein
MMRRFGGCTGVLRALGICGALMAVVLVAAACGSSSSSKSTSSSSGGGASSGGSSSAQGPIKLGNISDMTGPVPLPYGVQGANAFFKKINSQGGIDGRKVVLTVEDDQLNPVRAAQGARTLNSDGVIGLVGDESLASCTTNGKYFAQVGLRDIYAGGAELACFNAANISPINVGPLGDWLLTERFVSEKYPDDKNAVCALETNTGTANPYHLVADSYAKTVFGGKGFLYINNTLNANSDVNELIVTAKQQGCKVIMTDSQPTQTASFINDAKTQGLDAHFVFQGAQYSPQLATAIPHSTPGQIYSIAEVQPFTEPSPVINLMKSDFTAAGVQINGLTEFGWEAARMFYNIAKTIKGPITRDSYNKALLAATAVNTGGMTATPYAFGPGSKHQPNQSAKIVSLVNGKWVTVSGWVTLPKGVIPSG